MTRRVLVVCTANACRSPMAEAILRHMVAASGLDVALSSAGTRVPGLGVDAEAVVVMREAGLDIGSHRPRQVTRELLCADGADLVVTMTRQHVREVVEIDRTAWPRTFSLVELVRRTRGLRPLPGAWDDWLSTVAEGRTAHALLAGDSGDDIDDPYGMSLAVHRRTARRLDDLLHELVTLAPFPVRP